MNTGEGEKCPHCGKALPAGGLAGLCPACLLLQGAACDTVAPGAFVPPGLQELAEAFPQLEIIGLIGTGGMGAVYQARQRGLDRVVALKILPPGIDDRPGFAERFTREAKALAKLSHPGIVTIHDTGRANGLYYLLMEYVDGVNLRQLIHTGRVSPREALAIVPQICDALQYAHDAGVVHRDIKPENILLDRQGRVKVADFGLAKLMGADETVGGESADAGSYFTQMGHVMGTPQYMAPEQIAHPTDVDHRADIYSLGVVFYQMLTGELPGRSLEAPSRKVMIDVRLDEVVLRAMDKNPDHRYQQASQVRQVVETILSSPKPQPQKEGTHIMEIKFNCPGCDQKFSVDAAMAGAEVQCPACAQAMVVPHAGPPPPVMRAPSPHQLHPSFLPPVVEFRHKGLAIWAMVLGIIGIIPILGLATGLIGLVLGIVALVKKSTNQGMAIAGTALGGLAVLMIPFHIMILTSSLSGMKFVAQTTVCTSNLKSIGLAIISYQQQNDGRYPDRLDVLVKSGMISDKMLGCPVQAGKAGHSGFEYVRPSHPGAQGIIAWDSVPHKMDKVVIGRNVLHTDGSVKLMTEQQFRDAPRAGRQGGGPTSAPGPAVVKQSPDASRPIIAAQPQPQPEPVKEEMTLVRALEGLKTTPPREMRPLLKFLQDSPVEEEQRATVIAAVKPLLNDVDAGNMAFDAFAAWAGKEQVPDMIEMLNIAPTSPRGVQCMTLLSRMGDVRAAEPLAECLTQFHILRHAKAALAALGDIAKPAVLPYSHHEDRNAREAARELLRGYKATDEEMFAESIKALESGTVGARHSVMAELLKAKLSPEQQAAATRAMRPLVTSEDDHLRRAAQNAMKTLATPADAEFLLGLMESTDDWTRQLATDLLVKFKDVRVAKPLAALLGDPKKTHAAGRALVALGSVAEPALIPYLRNEDPTTRKRAAEVLGDVGTAASLPGLQALEKDKDFFIKSSAARSVASIKSRASGANGKR